MSAVAVLGCKDANDASDRIREIWFARQPGFTRAAPAVADSAVYVAGGDGVVRARRIDTGQELWATTVARAEELHGARLLTSGDAVIAQAVREVVALNRANGAVRWRYQPPLDTTGSGLPGYLETTDPDHDTEYVYVPAWGASVSAVHVATGAVRWVWRLGRQPSDTAANVFRSGAEGVRVSGDTVFATVWHFRSQTGGPAEAYLVALDRQTGGELWLTVLSREAGQPNSVVGAPLIAGNLAIVGSTYGWVHAVNRSTREIAWTFHSGLFQYSTAGMPATQGGLIYASGGDERLYALDGRDGTVVWTVPARVPSHDIMATGRRVYVVSRGQLSVFDAASGARVATEQLAFNVEVFESAPVVQGGQAFIMRTRGVWSFWEP